MVQSVPRLMNNMYGRYAKLTPINACATIKLEVVGFQTPNFNPPMKQHRYANTHASTLPDDLWEQSNAIHITTLPHRYHSA